MVSSAVYKIVLKAAKIRVDNGEDMKEVVESYNKLSQEQQKQLLNDLKSKED